MKYTVMITLVMNTISSKLELLQLLEALLDLLAVPELVTMQ